MHIKVERFLTLTAMLASTQVGLVGCGDDGTEAETGGDAGRSDSTAEPSSSSTGAANQADSGAGEGTGELNASLDNGEDAGTVAADAGDAAPAVDADVTSAADASDAATESWTDAGGETPWTDAGGETPWTDAGGETPWGDTADEGWTDAGGESCLAGDFADESIAAACYATFESCEYSYAREVCGTVTGEYRSGIAETFWDCYTESDVEDPCSENADYVASSCHSFAIENAPLCEVTLEECESVVADCAEVTLDTCEAFLSQYNSGRRAQSVYCFEAHLANQPGPDYEGCGYDFTTCAYSPSVE